MQSLLLRHWDSHLFLWCSLLKCYEYSRAQIHCKQQSVTRDCTSLEISYHSEIEFEYGYTLACSCLIFPYSDCSVKPGWNLEHWDPTMSSRSKPEIYLLHRYSLHSSPRFKYHGWIDQILYEKCFRLEVRDIWSWILFLASSLSCQVIFSLGTSMGW